MNVTKNLWLNPSEIQSMYIDDYWQNPKTNLIIVMKNGQKHLIEHNPSYFDGSNVYKIKQNIEEFIKGNKNVLLEGQ